MTMPSSPHPKREIKTMFPRPNFFGVLTLQGEKMLAEAVPGIAADAEEMQAVRAIAPVQCIALCAQLGTVCTPFDSSALYRCFLVSTTPAPTVSSIASFPIDPKTSAGGHFSLAIRPDPPLPVEGCHFWDNGDVLVRIQRRNAMFDHSQASCIHADAAAKLSRTYGVEDLRQSGSAQSEAALEWRQIAETMGWTGHNSAKRYPLAEFSLDLLASGEYCSPSEYHDAVEQVRSVIRQAWTRQVQSMDVIARAHVPTRSTESRATAFY